MFKIGKTKRFVYVGDYNILACITASKGDREQIESIQEIEYTDLDQAKNKIKDFFSHKKGNYVRSYCSINPQSRFIHKVSIDSPYRSKEPNFISDLLKNDLNLSENEHDYRVVNGSDGYLFDPERSLQKDLYICGAKYNDILFCQEKLVKLGLYPNRVELGCMLDLAGLFSYSKTIPVNCIIFDINNKNNQVSIFYQNNVSRIRSIAFGINDILPLIQKELALKDDVSAKQLLFSNTFDFVEKGSTLLNRLTRELQALIDYHEVQTGYSITSILPFPLPKYLSWISTVISSSINLPIIKFDYAKWFAENKIALNNSININDLDYRWFKLFSMIPGL